MAGSVIKFLFLYFSSLWVIQFFLSEQIAQKVSIMFSWPQLVTALAGGIISCLVLKMLNKSSCLASRNKI